MDCYFCKRNIKEVNWQDADLLRRFITGLGKIKRKDKTSLCAKHQRLVSRAIKRARHLGLLSAERKY
jgi:small subunit ribosomal protein S18